MERVLSFLEKPHKASDKDLAAKVGGRVCVWGGGRRGPAGSCDSKGGYRGCRGEA